MTPLARHTLGACILGGLMMTATLAFSACQPENEVYGVAKSDMLLPVDVQKASYTPSFSSAAGTKQARANFNIRASDRKRIAEAVIEQLKAFENNDAETAYNLAAPLARSEYGSADNFLNNLGDIYSLITTSTIERLDGLDTGSGDPRQRMLLTSPSGRLWMAYFTMQKQSDGAWKILGFMIEDAPGQVI